MGCCVSNHFERFMTAEERLASKNIYPKVPIVELKYIFSDGEDKIIKRYETLESISIYPISMFNQFHFEDGITYIREPLSLFNSGIGFEFCLLSDKQNRIVSVTIPGLYDVKDDVHLVKHWDPLQACVLSKCKKRNICVWLLSSKCNEEQTNEIMKHYQKNQTSGIPTFLFRYHY